MLASVLVGIGLMVVVWWVFTQRQVVDPTPNTQSVVEAPKSVDIGGKVTEPKKNLFENISQSQRYSTFVTAAQVGGLVTLFQSGQVVTVFAPDNVAFGKLSREAMQTLFKPENKAQLTDLLNYHIVPGKYLTTDLSDGLTLKTVQGRELRFTQKDGQWWINGHTLIHTADVVSINGVMHGVDAVLTAPKQ